MTFGALKGQHIPARGNAPGKNSREKGALKGRDILNSCVSMYRPFRAPLTLFTFPGALPRANMSNPFGVNMIYKNKQLEHSR